MAALDDVLKQAVDAGARSLLLHPGGAPRVRANDRAFNLDSPKLDDDALRSMCLEVLSDEDRRRLASSDLTFQTIYRSTTLGPFEMRVFRYGRAIGAAFRCLSETEARTYCKWCGLQSLQETECSACHRPLGVATSTQASAEAQHAADDPEPAPEERPHEPPADAAVPSMLSGGLPPRAGYDAKPMPKGPGDIEPPREP